MVISAMACVLANCAAAMDAWTADYQSTGRRAALMDTDMAQPVSLTDTGFGTVGGGQQFWRLLMADFEQLDSGLLVPANFATQPASNARPEMREVASTSDGRDITRGYLDPMSIQPTTDNVLMTRGNGDYNLYKEVLRDDQVGSTFNQRRLAVSSKEWGVDPGGKTRKDKAAADFMAEQIQHIGWDRVTEKMLFGIFYGFAVAEPMWGRDSRFITIDRMIVRNRQRFGFDGKSRLRMRTWNNPEGELMPDKKFWHFTTGGDHDDEPYGLGLGHWLYWPSVVSSATDSSTGWCSWRSSVSPPPRGLTRRMRSLTKSKSCCRALGAISTDAGVIVPDGMAIELLEAARSGTADYSSLMDRMDRGHRQGVPRQTASSEGTPGKLGNDELQGDVRQDLVKADADLVCESFNTSVGRWVTEWNFPGAAVPRVYRKVEPDEDTSKRAERDKTIYDMGFKPTLKHIQDNYGGEWEEKAPANDPPAVPGNEANFCCGGPIRAPAAGAGCPHECGAIH